MTLTDLAAEIERLDAEATPGPWDAPGERFWEGLLVFGIDKPLANFDTITPMVGHRNAWLTATLRNHAAHIAQALRLLERANDTIVMDGMHGNKAWKDDYAALCAELKGG